MLSHRNTIFTQKIKEKCYHICQSVLTHDLFKIRNCFAKLDSPRKSSVGYQFYQTQDGVPCSVRSNACLRSRKKNCQLTHSRSARASSSISRPQKCIIFLENMGTPSSIWLGINLEKGKKILTSNTTSGTCALYNFQPCIIKKHNEHSAPVYTVPIFNTKYRIV